MPVIVLPDPALVVLVGAAGAGKSSLAGRHFAADEILSSDTLREAIAGSATDQRATRPAFAALHRSLARRLASGRLTVVDATSVERHARLSLMRRARTAGMPAVAIVLDLPPAVVVARNAGRGDRTVDPDVVVRHLALLRAAVDRRLLDVEGWSSVVRLRDPADVDAVRIERRSWPWAPPAARTDEAAGPDPAARGDRRSD